MLTDQILDDPAPSQRRLAYAGFWIRFAALIIDSLVLGFCYGILFTVIFPTSYQTDPDMIVPMVAIYGCLGIIYFCGMESSSRQATPGKMAMGIKVGNLQGERISFLNALGRYFAKILSGLILYIGYIMAAWDPKKQALHDKLANTVVFYG